MENSESSSVGEITSNGKHLPPEGEREISQLWEFLADFVILKDEERKLPYPLAEPLRIGKFRLEAVLGLGAHGVVFEATDLNLGRKVAAKSPWPWMLRPKWEKYLEREPKTLAALNHPGIVQVHDGGDESLAFITILELIEGPTLSEWMKKQTQIAPRIAANILHQVAIAMAKAHELRIIHRDLKPSNILLRPIDTSCEFPYQPVVTDFGMARQSRVVEGATNATTTLAFVGTDFYMSPEQAAGQSSDVGPSSDVFSLGVILYELLAGKRPFEGETASEVREHVQKSDPPSLLRQRPDVPRDIETIVFKCLDKSPSGRYPTAKELADDLGRFLNQQPIHAKRTGIVGRGLLLARRSPWVTTVTLVILLAIVIVLGLVGQLAKERTEANRQILESETAKLSADAARREAEELKREREYAEQIRIVGLNLARGNRAEVLTGLKRAQELERDPTHPGLAWNLLTAMTKDADRVFKAHIGSVTCIRFSPDGKYLISGGHDGRVAIWDIKAETLKKQFQIFSSTLAMEFSSDGSLLAMVTDRGAVIVLRTDDYSKVYNEQLKRKRLVAVKWIGERKQFVTGGVEGVLYLIDPLTKEIRRSPPLSTLPRPRAISVPHSGLPTEIAGLEYLPQENKIAVLSQPPDLLFVDPSNLAVVDSSVVWQGLDAGSFCCFPASEGHIALGGNQDIAIFRVSDRKLVAAIPISGGLKDMRYSRAAGAFVIANVNGSVQSIKIRNSGSEWKFDAHTFLGHVGKARSVDISSDGQSLASAGEDGTVRTWQLNRESGGFDIPMPCRPVTLQFSPRGNLLALESTNSDDDGIVSIIDVERGNRLWSTKVPGRHDSLVEQSNYKGTRPLQAIFCNKLEQLLVLRTDGGFDVRMSDTGQLLKSIPGSDFLVSKFWSSPDDDRVIINGYFNGKSADIECVVLDRKSGRSSSHSIPYDRGSIIGSFITQFGYRWVGTDSSHMLFIRDKIDGLLLRQLGPIRERIHTVAISYDGKYIAAGTQQEGIYLWDLTQEGNEYDRLLGGENGNVALLFSRDGRVLLAHGQDGIVRSWDVPTGTDLFTLGSKDLNVFCAALHPKDKLLVLGIEESERYALRIYRLGKDQSSIAPIFEKSLAGVDKDAK